MERISLAREYRVADWLRDAYLELITQKTTLDFEEFRPAEPYIESNPLDNRDWEAEARKWETTSRDWETLARISQLQTKVATSIASITSYHFCSECRVNYGASYRSLCKCRLLALVDEAFREELENLKENPKHIKHPLRRKLPTSFFCARSKQFCIGNKGSKITAPKKRKRRKRAY